MYDKAINGAIPLFYSLGAKFAQQLHLTVVQLCLKKAQLQIQSLKM